MENYGAKQSYYYSSYLNTGFDIFKREFEKIAKQGKKEYMEFQQKLSQEKRTPPKPQDTPKNQI